MEENCNKQMDEDQSFYQTLKLNDVSWTKKRRVAAKSWYKINSKRDPMIIHCFTTALMNHDKKKQFLSSEDYAIVWDSLAEFLKSDKVANGSIKLEIKPSFVKSIIGALSEIDKWKSIDFSSLLNSVVSCCEVLLKNECIPDEILRKQPDSIFEIVKKLVPILANQSDLSMNWTDFLDDLVDRLNKFCPNKKAQKRQYLWMCSEFGSLATIFGRSAVKDTNLRLTNLAAVLLKSTVFSRENGKLFEELVSGNLSELNCHGLQLLPALNSETIKADYRPNFVAKIVDAYAERFPKSDLGLEFARKVLDALESGDSDGKKCALAVLKVVAERNLYVPMMDIEGHRKAWLAAKFERIFADVEASAASETGLKNCLLCESIPVFIVIETSLLRSRLEAVLKHVLKEENADVFAVLTETFAKLRQLPELTKSLIAVLTENRAGGGCWRLTGEMVTAYGVACETLGPIQAKGLREMLEDALSSCISDEKSVETLRICLLLKFLAESINLLKYQDFLSVESLLKIRKRCCKLNGEDFELSAWILGWIAQCYLIVNAEYGSSELLREAIELILKKIKPKRNNSNSEKMSFLAQLKLVSWILTSSSLKRECNSEVREATAELMNGLNREEAVNGLSESELLAWQLRNELLLSNSPLLISISGESSNIGEFADWVVESSNRDILFLKYLKSPVTWENRSLGMAVTKSLIISLSSCIAEAFENGKEKAVWVEKYAEHILPGGEEKRRKISSTWTKITSKLLDHAKRGRDAGKMETVKIRNDVAYGRLKKLLDVVGNVPMMKFQDESVLAGLLGAMLSMAVVLEGCDESLLQIFMTHLTKVSQCPALHTLIETLPESLNSFLGALTWRAKQAGPGLQEAVLGFLASLMKTWRGVRRGINLEESSSWDLKLLKISLETDTTLAERDGPAMIRSLLQQGNLGFQWEKSIELRYLAISVLSLWHKFGGSVMSEGGSDCVLGKLLLSGAKAIRNETAEVEQVEEFMDSLVELFKAGKSNAPVTEQRDLVLEMSLENLIEVFVKHPENKRIESACLKLIPLCTNEAVKQFLADRELSEALAIRILLLKALPSHKAEQRGAMGSLVNADAETFLKLLVKEGRIFTRSDEERILSLSFILELLRHTRNNDIVKDSYSLIGLLFTLIPCLHLQRIKLEKHKSLVFHHIFEFLSQCLRNNFSVVANMIGCFVSVWRMWLFLNLSVYREGGIVARECCQKLTRFAMSVAEKKEQFGKVAPYMIADFVEVLQEMKPDLGDKKLVLPGVYGLLDITDKHGMAMLFTNMKPSGKEYFRVIYEEYEKFHRYKGFV